MNIPMSEIFDAVNQLIGAMNDPLLGLEVLLIVMAVFIAITVAVVLVQKFLPWITELFSSEKPKNDDPSPSLGAADTAIPRYGGFARSLQPNVQLEKRKNDEAFDEKPKRDEAELEWTIGDDGEIKEFRR